MKNTHFFAKAPLALGLAIATAGTVQAQSSLLEEIIVTAERRESTLQETDISMTVFTADHLEEIGVSTYIDLADMSPNVMMHDMPGKIGGGIAIRGFKNAETIPVFEPKVALYVDGVIIAKNSGSQFDVLDLERVEILRGPQGTLYGRNTVGGAVNLITKKPSDEFEGKLKVTLGDFEQQDFKANVNVPLVGPNGILNNKSDVRLNLKASLASIDRDGYWKNTEADETLGGKDRQVGHLQLQLKPSDNVSILYAYDISDVDESTNPLAPVAFGPGAPALEPLLNDGGGSSLSFGRIGGASTQAVIEGHSLTVDMALNDNLSLVAISAFRKTDVDNTQDSDSSALFLGHNKSGDEVDTTTHEVRLLGTAADSRLQYVVGAYYMKEDIEDTYSDFHIGTFSQPLDEDVAFFQSARFASAAHENWAIFGEGTYSLTEKLDLTLGLRYTEEEKSLNRTDVGGFVFCPCGPGKITPGGVQTKLPVANETFDDVSGTVSLTYQWNDDAMTYIKVSKGYSSGGFNPRSATSDVDIFLAGFEEEIVYTYELGWKTTWLDNRLLLNGSLFYSDYQDLQVNQLTPTGSNNIDNAGDAEITGLELEFVAMPMDNLEIGGGYGYLDPKYKTFLDAGGTDLSNNHWAHAPENTFNIFGRYLVPNFAGWGDLSLRVDWAYVDDHFLLTDNTPGLVDGNFAPSYDFINARATLDIEEGLGGNPVKISIWGKNLGDELYYTSGFDLSLSLGFVAKAPAPPRTYGVDLTIEF